ncbi:hypothetical protein ACFW17_11705, partial [Streptomyces sp. NPDC058961]
AGPARWVPGSGSVRGAVRAAVPPAASGGATCNTRLDSLEAADPLQLPHVREALSRFAAVLTELR